MAAVRYGSVLIWDDDLSSDHDEGRGPGAIGKEATSQRAEVAEPVSPSQVRGRIPYFGAEPPNFGAPNPPITGYYNFPISPPVPP